jgi:hypothetical protein
MRGLPSPSDKPRTHRHRFIPGDTGTLSVKATDATSSKQIAAKMIQSPTNLISKEGMAR